MRATEAQGPRESALLRRQVGSCGCFVTQRELPSGLSDHAWCVGQLPATSVPWSSAHTIRYADCLILTCLPAFLRSTSQHFRVYFCVRFKATPPVSQRCEHAGNYRDGALQAGARNCDHNKQFDEKRCRLLLDFDMPVCNGSVVLHYVMGNPALSDVCGAQPGGNLTLWSIGNHQLSADKGAVVTINSVPHHVAFMQQGAVCPVAAQHPAACRLWWCVPGSPNLGFRVYPKPLPLCCHYSDMMAGFAWKPHIGSKIRVVDLSFKKIYQSLICHSARHDGAIFLGALNMCVSTTV